MPTFGETDNEDTEQFYSGETLACRFYCPDFASVLKMSAYVDNRDAVIIHNIVVGIYNDNSGLIGTHIVHSSPISIPGNYGDFIDVSINCNLPAGYYWLCLAFDSSRLSFGWVDNPSFDIRSFIASFGSWPDNPSSFASYVEIALSIYATYDIFVSPNRINKRSPTGQTCFVGQYIKHCRNGTPPWRLPSGETF